MQTETICSTENIKPSLFGRVLEPLTMRTQAQHHVVKNLLSSESSAPLLEKPNLNGVSFVYKGRFRFTVRETKNKKLILSKNVMQKIEW